MEGGRAREGRHATGQQPVDGCLTGLCMDPSVIDSLDPGSEEPVELGQVIRRVGLDLDQELHAHRLEGPLELSPALGPPRFGVHEAHPETGARPQ